MDNGTISKSTLIRLPPISFGCAGGFIPNGISIITFSGAADAEECGNMLTARHDWVRLFEGETARDVIPVLADILQTRRWFGGKARRIKEVRILDCIPIPTDSTQTLLLIRVEYGDAGTETYTLPVTAAFGEEAERIRRDFPTAVIAPLVLQRDGSEHT